MHPRSHLSLSYDTEPFPDQLALFPISSAKVMGHGKLHLTTLDSGASPGTGHSSLYGTQDDSHNQDGSHHRSRRTLHKLVFIESFTAKVTTVATSPSGEARTNGCAAYHLEIEDQIAERRSNFILLNRRETRRRRVAEQSEISRGIERTIFLCVAICDLTASERKKKGGRRLGRDPLCGSRQSKPDHYPHFRSTQTVHAGKKIKAWVRQKSGLRGSASEKKSWQLDRFSTMGDTSAVWRREKPSALLLWEWEYRGERATLVWVSLANSLHRTPTIPPLL